MASTLNSSRVSGVVDGAPETEPHLPTGEVLDDGAGVGQRTGKTVELCDDERVAGATGGRCLTKTWPLAVGPGQTLVDVRLFGGDAERGEGISLSGQVLLVCRHSGEAISRASMTSSW